MCEMLKELIGTKSKNLTLAYYKFNKQIKWRERKYGNPLPILQKIKAARAVSHEIYPSLKQGGTYCGIKGHMLREHLRKKLLKTVNFNYKIKEKS